MSNNPVKLKLVSVTAEDKSANFTGGRQGYKGVKPLQTFGTYFGLFNLHSGNCGTILYGDVTFDAVRGRDHHRSLKAGAVTTATRARTRLRVRAFAMSGAAPDRLRSCCVG